MQPKFYVTIRTADRQPGKNYLLDTLANLERAGLFKPESRLLAKVAIIDTGKPGDLGDRARLWSDLHAAGVSYVTADKPLTPNENALVCLLAAAASRARWHLFLEDDIDVCADFLQGIDAWLEKVATDDVLVYPLCANYTAANRKKGETWPYPVNNFYGTQAYLIRTEDSARFADWMEEHLRKSPMKQGHDLLLKEWHLQAKPGTTALKCPTPDFVQHIGEESSLHKGRFHDYPLWGGQTWSYINGSSTFFTLAEHAKNKYSDALAGLLLAHLSRQKRVYDLGCGVGRYVSRLQTAGFDALGIEGTPGIEAMAMTSNVCVEDLSRPLPARWATMPRGSVISLEVGEHIPKSAEGIFLDNIDLLCDKDLVLSWAVKGQGGLRHLNEMDADELVPKLEARGFELLQEETRRFREIAGMELRWFKKSIYVFRRKA